MKTEKSDLAFELKANLDSPKVKHIKEKLDTASKRLDSIELRFKFVPASIDSMVANIYTPKNQIGCRIKPVSSDFSTSSNSDGDNETPQQYNLNYSNVYPPFVNQISQIQQPEYSTVTSSGSVYLPPSSDTLIPSSTVSALNAATIDNRETSTYQAWVMQTK